ncbi:MAG: hypothetical protein HYS13_03885 [Planctomycetia bacterium]|nr:hypothetical protein [Planctomycetia bacterium]
MIQPSTLTLPRYDISRDYAWNYEHAPEPVKVDVPPVGFVGVPALAGGVGVPPSGGVGAVASWTFCGLPVASPLGVAAGPLLNGRWVLYYASLGFDVLTYKTVRSGLRPCYPLPNLQPVTVGPMDGSEERVHVAGSMQGSWAVSFGMPSQEPGVWRADIERTRARLPRGKLLSVSVVGTIQEGWTIDDLAADYARCALWSVESGADCVEMNFSCPNVATCDGQLYQDAAGAALVAGRVRCEIGKQPLIVKIGRVASEEDARALLDALRPHVDALAMTNSIATFVVGPDGEKMFDGQRRGICGSATFQASVAQVAHFDRLQREHSAAARRLDLIGVGGASTAEHVRAYLAAGASAVHLATAVMVDPEVGLKIRRGLR